MINALHYFFSFLPIDGDADDGSISEKLRSWECKLLCSLVRPSETAVTTKSFDRFRPAKKGSLGVGLAGHWAALHWAAKNPLRPHLSRPRALSSLLSAPSAILSWVLAWPWAHWIGVEEDVRVAERATRLIQQIMVTRSIDPVDTVLVLCYLNRGIEAGGQIKMDRLHFNRNCTIESRDQVLIPLSRRARDWRSGLHAGREGGDALLCRAAHWECVKSSERASGIQIALKDFERLASWENGRRWEEWCKPSTSPWPPPELLLSVVGPWATQSLVPKFWSVLSYNASWDIRLNSSCHIISHLAESCLPNGGRPGW